MLLCHASQRGKQRVPQNSPYNNSFGHSGTVGSSLDLIEVRLSLEVQS